METVKMKERVANFLQRGRIGYLYLISDPQSAWTVPSELVETARNVLGKEVELTVDPETRLITSILEVSTIAAPISEPQASEAVSLPRQKREGRLEFADPRMLVSSPWSVNEMDAETYEGIRADMQANGLFGIDPVQVFPSGVDEAGAVRLQIFDGHYRSKAAVELGWQKARIEIFDITESEAKVRSYRKARERGKTNPVKEAELFFSEWEKGKGKLTQEQIGERYGVSQAHVSERLGLLNLPQEVTKEVKAAVLPSSHAEAIYRTAINPEAQVAVARAAVKRRLSPEETRMVAEQVQKEAERLPEAPATFFEEKADKAARDIKHAERGGKGKPIEIETITCEECDADFRIYHLGPNRHKLVRVEEK